MFTTLRELCLNEINAKYSELIEETQTEDGLKAVLRRYNKTYTQNPQKKLLKFLDGRKNKEINNMLEEIAAIEGAEDFNEEFIITIEWVRSSVYGRNARVYTSAGFEYKGISGCGYDKVSTATAHALNSNLSILKLLYAKKEEGLNKMLQDGNAPADYENGFNRPYLGYGSGYGILPHFEGGVGTSSHINILNNIGLTMTHISDTSHADVYLVKKQV